MSRPKCCRKIGCTPDTTYFKPKGIPVSQIDEVSLNLDEFEAIRLADFEGLYQEAAADKMGISRQTFGRIIVSAHKKISDVLINGKALKIEGEKVAVKDQIIIKCPNCKKSLNSSGISGHIHECPFCNKIIPTVKEKK